MTTSFARTALCAAAAITLGCASPTRFAPPADAGPPALAPEPPPSAAQDAPAAPAGSDKEALAKQLANPIASLVSVPLQLNYDEDIGRGDGERWVLNVQPVIPISLSEDWNLISRTILPVIDQSDIPPGDDETGIGDIVQSLFFSPVEPTAGGWIWGAGPVFLVPTATDETLGGEQWGLGPTGVALKQAGPWTYGMLANHIWSFAGDDDRADVNATFLQPFVAYTTPAAWTYTLNSEATYDWEEDDLALPLNAVVSKVISIGGQRISIAGGLRYWVEDSDASPEGLGFRFVVTLLFPK